MNSEILNIKSIISEKDWTLFLDRDGVINKRIIDDYVKSVDDFVFIEGVLDSISIFSKYFQNIIVVTNQQGIGKKLMTEVELEKIHSYLLKKVEVNNGRIDKIYHCPDLASENSKYRKPNTGMGLKAKEDFPEIDFKKSIMIGDSLSDMQFAKNLGIISVAVGDELFKHKSELIDYKFNNMLKFASIFY